MSKLTDQQKVACNEYLVTNNWLKSMLKAKYSYKYANKRGWELLEKPHIKEYISKKQAELADKVDITVEYTLKCLKETYNNAVIKQDYSTCAYMDGRHRSDQHLLQIRLRASSRLCSGRTAGR